jgi:hypothetical protein
MMVRLGIFLLLMSSAVQAEEAVRVAEQFPTAGVATGVSYPDGVDALHILYQPEASYIPLDETIRVGGTSYSWTPARAGIVRLEALKGGEVLFSTDVSVKFAGTPLAGLAIFFLAGAILFGGSFFSLRAILSEPE